MRPDFGIVVDSTSDFPQKLLNELDIKMVNAFIIIEDTEYEDRVNITRIQLLEALNNPKLRITTSQPSPKQFLQVFQELLTRYKKVLYIGLSSKLSGTFQNAVIAANKLSKEKVYCYDTLSLSYGNTVYAYHAAIRRKDGVSLETVLKELDQIQMSISLYITVGDLEYMRRGGRIGRARGILGKLLHIKPVLTIKEGELEVFKTSRGIESARQIIFKNVINDARKFKNFIFLSTCGIDDDDFNSFVEKITKNIKPLKRISGPLGPIVLCHVGPIADAVVLAKIPKKSVKSYLQEKKPL